MTLYMHQLPEGNLRGNQLLDDGLISGMDGFPRQAVDTTVHHVSCHSICAESILP